MSARHLCYNNTVFGTIGSEAPTEYEQSRKHPTIYPPLWVYASAHRLHPMRAGFIMQMEVKPHEQEDNERKERTPAETQP